MKLNLRDVKVVRDNLFRSPNGVYLDFEGNPSSGDLQGSLCNLLDRYVSKAEAEALFYAATS